MQYKTEKEMLFYFLRRIDYSMPLKDVLYGVGYDMGDFAFTKYTAQQIIELVKHTWVVLNETA